MLLLGETCTLWHMPGYSRITFSEGPPTRLGRIVLAGEVRDDEPVMPGSLRVMDDYVVSLVVDGKGSYRHADGRVEPIVPPAVTVVPPGEPHWYGTGPGGTWSEWFVVAQGSLFDLLRTSGILGHAGPVPVASGARAAEFGLLVGSRPPSVATAEQQLWSLGSWLLDVLQPDVDDGPMARAEAMLTADLSRPVDLEGIAAGVGLSYDGFRRQFTAQFGSPPRAYRNRRRIDSAATLLRLTMLTTREIARRLGYTDEFHLSRRFRQQFGVPPRTYRKSQRES